MVKKKDSNGKDTIFYMYVCIDTFLTSNFGTIGGVAHPLEELNYFIDFWFLTVYMHIFKI